MVALSSVIAAVVIGTGFSASFDDTGPCPTIGPYFTCPTGTVGKPYSVQLKGKTGCDQYWYEVLSGSLPAGLSMSRGGLISGVPTAEGRSDFYVQIHDVTAAQGGYEWCGYDDRSQKQFVINIDPRLSITTQSVPAGTVGQSYSQTLTASMAAASWAVQSGSLPPGVTLTPYGALSGTPTEAGTYPVVISAEAGSASDARLLTIVVRQPVVITPLPLHWDGLHGSEVGIPIDAALSAAGGTGTYAWTLSGGSLPSGVVLSQDGTITGTPATAGDSAFIVEARDTEGRTTTLNVTLHVAARLSIKTLKLKSAKVGRAYSATLRTFGGAEPLKWNILSGKLPRGIHFAKKIGVFVGTPRRAGRYRVTVESLDAYSVEAQKMFLLVVKA